MYLVYLHVPAAGPIWPMIQTTARRVCAKTGSLGRSAELSPTGTIPLRICKPQTATHPPTTNHPLEIIKGNP